MQVKEKVHLFFIFCKNFRKGQTLVNKGNKWYSFHGSYGTYFCTIFYNQINRE